MGDTPVAFLWPNSGIRSNCSTKGLIGSLYQKSFWQRWSDSVSHWVRPTMVQVYILKKKASAWGGTLYWHNSFYVTLLNFWYLDYYLPKWWSLNILSHFDIFFSLVIYLEHLQWLTQNQSILWVPLEPHHYQATHLFSTPLVQL
jgi:hypothetical protein